MTEKPTPAPVRRIRGLTRLLDDWIAIPGTSFRIGLDPLIGLVPGLGDVLATALSGYVVIESARLGAPWPVVLRMLGNLALDAVLGSAPVLGDLFDATWKANRRNMDLLDRYLAQPAVARRASLWVVAGSVLAVSGLVGGIAFSFVALGRLLLGG